MLTKRETLKYIAQYGQCGDCINCPYDKEEIVCSLLLELKKLGAKEMLKSLPQEFDKTKILTCVTADQAKVGQKGLFASCLESLESKYKYGYDEQYTLIKVRDAICEARFVDENYIPYSLFYPIDEVEE